MAIYGYCRKSTAKQEILRQIRNILREYPEARIIEETWTGTSLERPKFQKMLQGLKAGDTVVFDEVSRMSRSAEDGFELYEKLYKQGIELVFLKEPHISTTTYRTALQSSIQMTGTAVDCILEGINEYLMALAKEQIKLAFARAQAETDFLRQRTTEGIRNSDKKSGHPKGSTYETRKEKACKEIIAKYNVDFGGSLSDSETMRMCGDCSRNSFYKYKAKVKIEKSQRG